MSSVNLKRKKQTNAQMSEVMDEFDRFEYFFATHWKKIVLTAVIAVLAVAVYCTVDYFTQKKSREAATAFAQAEKIEDFEKALQKYSDAPGWVYLQLGGLYMNEGEYDQAKANLQKAAADSSVPEIQWRATLNLAALDELQGKFAEAAAAFEDFARNRRETGSAGFALEAYCAAIRNHISAKNNSQAQALIAEANEFFKALSAAEQSTFSNYNLVFAGLSIELAPAPQAK